MSAPVRHVILKIASRCNLNCRYCYLYNHTDRTALVQPKTLSEPVFEALLKRMAEHCERHRSTMGLTLHGGEPTLIGLERFEHLVGKARAILGDGLHALVLQTNATLLNDNWAGMLVRHGVDVGISLDGPPRVHDRVRVTHTGRGSHAETLRGIAALRRAGHAPKILCVVDPQEDGAEIYRHFRALGIECFDFLLPDVSHDNRTAFYGEAPHPVYDYLAPALDAWMEENNPRVVIPLFTELLRSLMSGEPVRSECFGNPTLNYVVVNTDGSIEPLDALKVCADRLTDVGANVFEHSFDSLARRGDLLGDVLNGREALGPTCRACPRVDICGGGYLPHRYRRANGFANPSVWCADIRLLLDDLERRILQAGSAPAPGVNAAAVYA